MLSMFQALNAGKIISKELLFKDVSAADRSREGERFPLGFVDWDRNGDPDLYWHTHLAPVPVDGEPRLGPARLGLLGHSEVQRSAGHRRAG